jgi:hypothetical protein
MTNSIHANTNVLTAKELEHLKRWQRWMIGYFIVFLVGTGLLLLIGLTVGFSKWIETGLTVLWTVFLLSGVFIQFSQKCPRCGYRIGRQSRLLLPRQCPKCRISFRG